MPWSELRVGTTSEHASAIEDSLLELGALAVSFADAADQPVLEPAPGEMPLWSEIVITGLFEVTVDSQAILQQLCSRHDGLKLTTWSLLEDRVWEREWLQHYRPEQFGEALWVYCEPVEDSELPTLILEPGLAFGTGSHPTTRLCLEWIASRSWSDDRIIDYGCGTGILALAALMLGCERSICVDRDPQAILATWENAKRNGIDANHIDVLYPEELDTNRLSNPVDVLIANILAGPLTELVGEFARLIRPGGDLCLSGLLTTQSSALITEYSNHFENFKQTTCEDWCCITAKRKLIAH